MQNAKLFDSRFTKIGMIRFASRLDAAQRLAGALIQYRGRNPLILAVPRGAVGMGAVIAEALEGELDVVLERKLGAPGSPEFAVGAVDETGWIYAAPHAESAGATRRFIDEEAREQLDVLRRRRAQYTPARAPADPAGRIVIVVDDGLATGASMIAALHAVRARRPARLICAVPVAPPDSLATVGEHADEVVCLATPAEFYAVGQFYDNFGQVDDDEVIALLRRQQSGVAARAQPR
jgi:predicted phosphoribosyltransferase